MIKAIVGLIFGAVVVLSEEPPPPTFEMMIGGMVPSDHHSYIAESRLTVPLLRVEPLTLSYRYAETTPFLKTNAQAQLLYARYEMEADFTLCDSVRLITIGGYRRTQFEDRPGSLSAYVVGGGFGSREKSPLEWSVVAGGYLSRERLDADWWANVHAVWRAWEGKERKLYDTPYRPALGLAVDVESDNAGSAFHALYRIGPVFDIVSANGNQLRFQARWFHTDANPFYEDRDSGLLLGVEVDASLEKDKTVDMRDQRPVGLLPLVWGQYNIGYGNERSVQEFELNAEIHDYLLGEHRVTAVLWYNSRQEQHNGDFDNISYSASPGLQTPIGLASPVSQGQPLVLGTDYEHRSAHALNPDASRVPPGTLLERGSVNILRLRLQTLGWDLPYRDPTIYQRKTEWLNDIDWRVTLGYDWHHSRDRSNPAAQLGLNWDAATIQGNVLYARGVGSIGNEIPDWLIECGVRRPWGKIFFKAERTGLEGRLSRATALVAGVGFNL